MRHRDNPELWIKLGQIIFAGLMIYYCWAYIAAILMMCGAYFLWKEWEKSNRG